MAESASGGESGAVLSDGELEEGEVLSSDEEDEEKEHKTEEKREKGERESGVITDLKDPVGEADEIGQKHPGPPAQTHAASPHSKVLFFKIHFFTFFLTPECIMH